MAMAASELDDARVQHSDSGRVLASKVLVNGDGATLEQQPLLERRIVFHPAKDTGLASLASSLPPGVVPLNQGFDDGRVSNAKGSGKRSWQEMANEDLKQQVKLQDEGDEALLLDWGTPLKIGAGLGNLGNTCFLNSVLQCLTYTPPLAKFLESGQHKATCRNSGFCAMCALEGHVKNALRSWGKVVSPNYLVKNLRCISRSFQPWRQEDAHEYMRYLMEALHKSCLRNRTKADQEKSLMYRIFGGRLRSQVKCTNCYQCSDTIDPFLDLSLDILKADSLPKALACFTATEILDGENKYHCAKCKKKVRALKRFTIETAPNILTIQFKRFSSSGNHGQKIDKNVHFGRTLDIKPFMSNGKNGAVYELYGVLVHSGWSTHSGHYYCFVRTSSDMWHVLDDSRVKQLSEQTVLQQKAYILFYIRKQKPKTESLPKQPAPVSRAARDVSVTANAGNSVSTLSLDSKVPATAILPTAPSEPLPPSEPTRPIDKLTSTCSSSEPVTLLLPSPICVNEVPCATDSAEATDIRTLATQSTHAPSHPEPLKDERLLKDQVSAAGNGEQPTEEQAVAPCPTVMEDCSKEETGELASESGDIQAEEKISNASVEASTDELERDSLAGTPSLQQHLPGNIAVERVKNGRSQDSPKKADRGYMKLLRAMPKSRRFFLARALELDQSDKSEPSSTPIKTFKKRKLMENEEAKRRKVVANGNHSLPEVNGSGVPVSGPAEDKGHTVFVCSTGVDPSNEHASHNSNHAEVNATCAVKSASMKAGAEAAVSASIPNNELFGSGVARWDGVEAKDIDVLLKTEHKTPMKKLDDWDEEYDRGKVKKVRRGAVGGRLTPYKSNGTQPQNGNIFQVLADRKHK